jgi:hypothetical protein
VLRSFAENSLSLFLIDPQSKGRTVYNPVLAAETLIRAHSSPLPDRRRAAMLSLSPPPRSSSPPPCSRSPPPRSPSPPPHRLASPLVRSPSPPPRRVPASTPVWRSTPTAVRRPSLADGRAASLPRRRPRGSLPRRSALPRPSFADGREIDPNEAQISSLNPEIWRISASPASNDLRRRDLVGSAGIQRDLGMYSFDMFDLFVFGFLVFRSL